MDRYLSCYEKIKRDIASVAHQYGRRHDDITLVAVSKGQSLKALQALYAQGQRLFGESRLQEAIPKIESCCSDIQWHFIGSLQKNKVRAAISAFHFIHSVDSLELAEKIAQCSQEAALTTQIFLQVNISGERSKHGLSPDEWLKSYERAANLPGIAIRGLMTIAPFDADEAAARRCFAGLRLFRDSLDSSLPYLSMGMSRDYPWAIAEGATHLRIGSALFAE